MALSLEIAGGAEPLATCADLAHVDLRASGVECSIAISQTGCVRQNLQAGDGCHGKCRSLAKPLGCRQASAYACEGSWPMNDAYGVEILELTSWLRLQKPADGVDDLRR